MIIVSNERVTGRSDKTLSYDEFKARAFSDEGLDVEDTLAFNVNELESEVYDCLRDQDVLYFTLTGQKPNFVEDSVNVMDWSKNDVLNNVAQDSTTHIQSNGNTNYKPDEEMMHSIENLLEDSTNENIDADGDKDAKIYVFGSSKGGTGKTFTAIISTYRYAKTHPHQKIALIDFDIIDGQVGISIHKINKTVREYLTEYQKGYNDFKTLQNFSVKASHPFPQNVDFYLAPNNGQIIENNDFWLNILTLCSQNYDVVVIDTGIDYLNIAPISYAYKIADKVILVTTTSIKSVNSVTKQIGKLTGDVKNAIFTKEDEIYPRLNIVITQMVPSNEMNKTIYSTLAKKCNVLATFGVITDSVNQAEFYGMWDVFDKNAGINKALDDIMA